MTEACSAIDSAPFDPIDVVNLKPLMGRTLGRSDVRVGLVDGPVARDHPDLYGSSFAGARGRASACFQPHSAACRHGTIVAGILAARRESGAPGICPGCTFVLAPVFPDTGIDGTRAASNAPTSTAPILAGAISDVIDAGVRVINISAAVVGTSRAPERELHDVLDRAMRRGVIVVVSAGNQARVAGTTLTRHPWVIPVVGYRRSGRVFDPSTLSASIGRRGVGAPGEGVTSLVPTAGKVIAAGTSVAAPFVTGAIALLWSLFPSAGAIDLHRAVTRSSVPRRRSVVAPLLDAEGAYEILRVNA